MFSPLSVATPPDVFMVVVPPRVALVVPVIEAVIDVATLAIRFP